jgi:hypothetical protein
MCRMRHNKAPQQQQHAAFWLAHKQHCFAEAASHGRHDCSCYAHTSTSTSKSSNTSASGHTHEWRRDRRCQGSRSPSESCPSKSALT